MLRTRNLFATLIIASFIFGCSKSNKPKETSDQQSISGNITVIADTIVYDVILRNIDTSDIWEAECLQYLDQKSLVNYLIDGVYNGQFIAIEFMGDKILSTDDVKAIEQENGFSRDRVSKVQFRERWYIDSSGNLQKQIINYTLGIEVYSKQNTFLGHEALFVVKPKS
ncbi:MAG TPA: hypothetical protein PLH91_06800 [Tenuifilaceae bacterium]|nr:hypothetical protein [Tenuifilaceae bacterium]HOZ14139.1 hypothetical protein [Tenuifilaceae bacterium]HPI44921.1 hypothetical protein [Tenuifilaceae bacterium]HPN20986.1 hypothetical protein [Tenuifilaceae bacterium]HPV55845.1 hypothetical protein [Tenuifilaceae bacterium]